MRSPGMCQSISYCQETCNGLLLIRCLYVFSSALQQIRLRNMTFQNFDSVNKKYIWLLNFSGPHRTPDMTAYHEQGWHVHRKIQGYLAVSNFCHLTVFCLKFFAHALQISAGFFSMAHHAPSWLHSSPHCHW